MHNAASGVTMEFKYNHNGLRTRKVKKVNGTITETTDYILKGKHIVAMKKNTDTYYFTYDASGKPATVTYNGVKYTYVKNLQGDIVAILDASGALVVEYRYDAWGAPTSIYSASTTVDPLAFGNPFRYRGYVWDEETELYYLRSRYYNPEVGRFLNIDTLFVYYYSLLSVDTYAYCKNNWIGYKDDTGNIRVGITIYINENYDTLKEIIENMEFGHAELTIEGSMGRRTTYSYGRYGAKYGSFGLRGEGILVIDNYQHGLLNVKSGRSIYRYELNLTEEEIYKMNRSIVNTTNRGELRFSDDTLSNEHDFYEQYYIDKYDIYKNNCVTKTLGFIKDGVGDKFPSELNGVIMPYELYIILEKMLDENHDFIKEKYILKPR